MIKMEPVVLHDQFYTSIIVEIPDTTLLIVSGKKGYIMCGALDIDILNTKWPTRKIAAGRALGVRSIAELLEAPLESVTKAAEALGVKAGMKGKDALQFM
ncbi:YunC family protein [Alteribacillus sp. JSM 102045]|uniref:YunC family protein n=1 Tax=Alteribacillus sp. JSM 102045 TaxID=1562101 RepID=UPI0035BFBEF8